jgi:hypothetical protein
VIAEPHLHHHDDRRREDQPEDALDQLVRDDDHQAAFASHGADCRLGTMRPHRAFLASAVAIGSIALAGGGAMVDVRHRDARVVVVRALTPTAARVRTTEP